MPLAVSRSAPLRLRVRCSKNLTQRRKGAEKIDYPAFFVRPFVVCAAVLICPRRYSMAISS
jgi:hypothetical protein